jgi:hypothetical protein
MKIYKSMILSAVAALVVAAGPEMAAPVIGLNVVAEAAARKPPRCRRNHTLTAITKIRADGSTKTVQRCLLNKTIKKSLQCKPIVGKDGKSIVGPFERTVKIGTKTKTVLSCKPTPAPKKAKKPSVTCVAPKVLRLKGTVIGKTRSGTPILSKADRCVAKPGIAG